MIVKSSQLNASGSGLTPQQYHSLLPVKNCPKYTPRSYGYLLLLTALIVPLNVWGGNNKCL
jgi:hypothetical protein